MTRSLLLTAPLSLLLACNGTDDDEPVDSDTDIGGATTQFTIRTRAAFADLPATCDRAYDGVGTGNDRVRLVDFRLFVHDVVLIDAGGREEALSLQADGAYNDGTAVLLDYATDQGDCAGGAGRNTQLVGTAPDRTYDTLRFTVGLPRDLSIRPVDAATPPLDVADMFLNSTVGRFHTKVSVLAESATEAHESFVHAVGCTTGGSCTSDGLVVVELSGFDPDISEVVFDLEKLLSRNDVSGGGCPSLPADDDCRTFFVSYGLGAGGPEWITRD